MCTCPCVSCFVAGLDFTLVRLLLIYQGIRLLLWLQGTAFFSFCVRAFCMRLLNSIHDEIVGNRSVPIGFASISRLKSPYKPTVQRVCTGVIVGKRFDVCSGAKSYAYTRYLARHRNYRQVLNLRSRHRRKTKNRLPPKNYRRIALPPKAVSYTHLTLPTTPYV